MVAPATQEMINVVIIADGKEVSVSVPVGDTVEETLDAAGITLGSTDRIEPGVYEVLSSETLVRVIRVKEEFTVEQEIIPFERKILQTESLPEGRTLLAQKGENGLREITLRHIYEDGVEISNKQMSESRIIEDAIPEIVMVGIQAPFTPIPIPGRIVYLLGGNAWMMEETTGNRRPVVTTGDLDGRIFSLSPDGTWLLFTRRSIEKDQINSLWAAWLDSETGQESLVDLKVPNIVHFADWVPISTNNKIVFSTVEPRSTAPGWQANNDLVTLNFSPSGWLSKWGYYVDANSGGVYGWWGTNFAWEPGGGRLAYARPDGIGLVNLEDGSFQSIMDILPLQTKGDWAWVPWITWGANGEALFVVNHLPQSGAPSLEESQIFDLAVVSFSQGSPFTIVSQTGMFAYPMASPRLNPEGIEYKVAYLQALFPLQSDSSRYRLMSMDRDGSNQVELFPPEGQPGLEPQRVAWSPTPLKDTTHHALAVIYQGNLWLVDVNPDRSAGKQAWQITGDGLSSRVVWGGGS